LYCRIVFQKVQADDQIVLESVKSPGQFMHASAPWQINRWVTGYVCFNELIAMAVSWIQASVQLAYSYSSTFLNCLVYFRSEINLGVNKAGFTVSKYYSPLKEHKNMVKVKYLCSIQYDTHSRDAFSCKVEKSFQSRLSCTFQCCLLGRFYVKTLPQRTGSIPGGWRSIQWQSYRRQ